MQSSADHGKLLVGGRGTSYCMINVKCHPLLVCYSTLPLVEDTVLALSVAIEFIAWRREWAMRGPGLEPLVWGLGQKRLAADEEGEKPGEAVRSTGRLWLLMALESSFSSCTTSVRTPQ